MANDVRVTYKAIADFKNLSSTITRLRTNLKKLRAEENAFNKNSTRTAASNAKSREKVVAGLKDQLEATRNLNKEIANSTKAVRDETAAIKNNSANKRSNVTAARALKAENKALRETITSLTNALRTNSSTHSKVKSSLDTVTVSVNKNAEAYRNASDRVDTNTGEIMENARETRVLQAALNNTLGLLNKSSTAHTRHSRSTTSNTRETTRLRTSLAQTFAEMFRGQTIMRNLKGNSDNLLYSFRRLATFRPRLMPPFIVLVPLIASVVAAINPLIALFGALGGAAIGLAGQIGSLAGALLALPGIAASVAAGVGSIITAFSGVGNVFKFFGQMRKQAVTGGGGGGTVRDQAREILRATQDIEDAQVDMARAYEDAAERITDAEDSYARSQRNVRKAQEALNDARKEAIEDLRDLRDEVSRAGLDEERAIANLTQAREEYYRVLADPGSTLGDKQDALADLHEAEADLEDVRKKNAKNASDLAKAEAKGVDQAEKVVDARESLQEALEAESDAYRELQRAQQDQARTQRDAQRQLEDAYTALQKAQAGDGGGGGGAANQFQDALDKLSPSARAVVLALLDMEAAWTAVQQNVQEAFFSKIVDDMDDLRSLIPVVDNMFSKMAGTLGSLASRAIKMLASGPWTRDFGIIADNNVKIMENMGDGAFSIATAIKDIMVAAGPFTIWLTDSLAKGAKNFSDLVAGARESGALAEWLDTVAKRLEQWWRIVKNIGLTLFNFSSAASDFGQWLTDGLEEMTKGWLQASEDAKKEGSPFKQWLEDIKPLLTDLRGLFGDFFGWLGREASNPENIQMMRDIIAAIRDDLGPAVGKLLDSLSKSGIGESFITALSSIIGFINELVDNGAFKTFYDTISSIFDALAWFVSIPGVASTLAGIAAPLGVLAGLTFVGQFTGLFALFGWLVRLANNGKISSLLSGLGRLGGMGGKHAAPKGEGGIGPSTGVKGAVGSAGIFAAAVLAFQGVVEQVGNVFGPDALGGIDVGKYFGGTREEREEQNRNLGNAAGAVSMPPALEALLDTLGLGEMADGWKGMIADFTTGALNAMDLFGPDGKLANGWNQIVGAWNGFMGWLGEVFNGGIVQTWEGFVNWLGEVFGGFGNWLKEVWDGFIVWLTEVWNGFIGWLGEVWNNIVNLWNGFMGWLGDVWNGIISFVQSVWNNIVNAFNSVISWIQTNIFGPIGDAFNRVANWIGDNVFRPIGDAFNNAVNWIRDNVFRPIGDAFDRAISFIRGIFDIDIGSVIRNAIGGIGNFFGGLFGSTGGAVGRNSIQYRATGGPISPNKGTDTVPAMLTPGEFVLRKAIVDAIGSDNLIRLNSGLITYADLLSSMVSQNSGGMNSSGVASLLAGGGLVNNSPSLNRLTSPTSSMQTASTTNNSSSDNSIRIEKVEIINPVPEAASDSLPRVVRKIGYMNR